MQVYPEHLRLNLRVLPGNAERWSELDIENRLDFTTEWVNQMFDLEDTARQYKRGELPERESEEFLSLLGAVSDEATDRLERLLEDAGIGYVAREQTCGRAVPRPDPGQAGDHDAGHLEMGQWRG